MKGAHLVDRIYARPPSDVGQALRALSGWLAARGAELVAYPKHTGVEEGKADVLMLCDADESTFSLKDLARVLKPGGLLFYLRQGTGEEQQAWRLLKRKAGEKQPELKLIAKGEPEGHDAASAVRAERNLGKHYRVHEKRAELLKETAEQVFTYGDTEVRLLLPAYVLDYALFEQMVGLGVGTFSDIVWPAEQALTFTLLQRRHLWKSKGVCELGAGLGLAGLAAAVAGAPRVIINDRDALTMEIAARSAVLNRVSNVVSVLPFDWTDREKWPERSEALVVAADVLYDPAAIGALADLVEHFGGEALFVDPVNEKSQESRSIERFEAALRPKRLLLQVEDFAGSAAASPMRILTVRRGVDA